LVGERRERERGEKGKGKRKTSLAGMEVLGIDWEGCGCLIVWIIDISE